MNMLLMRLHASTVEMQKGGNQKGGDACKQQMHQVTEQEQLWKPVLCGSRTMEA